MAAQPPEHDDRFYKPKSLIKWFGISSVLMLIVTIWMVLEDNNRSWKGHQREFMSIQKTKYNQWIEEEKGKLNAEQIEDLKKKVAEQEKLIEGKADLVEKLEDELYGIKSQKDIVDNSWRGAKAEWDVKRYKYEAKYGHYDAEAYIEGLEELYKEQKAAAEAAKAKALEEEEEDEEEDEEEEESADGAEASEAEDAVGGFTSEQLYAKMAESNKASAFKKEGAAEAEKKVVQDLLDAYKLRDQLNQLENTYQAKEAEIAAVYAEKKKLEKELEIARGQLGLYEKGLEDAHFGITKVIRSIPVVDLADPVFKLKQVVLPHIEDDLIFAQVGKVDRCMTCHLAIDKPGYEDQPNPYKSHPRLDIMLGSNSPHPMNEIGCTVCHDGRGQATDFVRAAHTPRNPEQQKEWEQKYHWHEMHHVPEKMVPLQYTEGRCVTCHDQTEYVPKGEKVNKAALLVRSAGCYGCHRVEGWDHMRKPGPSLKNVSGKLSKDFMVKWVRDPFLFNTEARMPKVFHLSNMQSEEFKKYQEAELFAAVDYILANSESYKPTYRVGLGNAERGKELFGSIGCNACHKMDDFSAKDPRGRFERAPNLSTVGSKVTVEWLNQWLKNPRHYWDETTMPSLRLSDSEVADLTAYLMTKKNPTFEAAPAGEVVVDDQKAVLKLYLARDPKLAPVTEAKIEEYVSKLEPHELSVDLGKRTIGRLGCYGCHDIKGFEGVQGIGTELTEWGSTMVKKLDFGYIHMEKTRHAFAYQKVSEPRSFDKGTVKEYLDSLRMPQFAFNEEEKHDLVLFLLGHTALSPGPPAQKVLSPREAKAEQAFQLIHKYNCQACHVVEDIYSPLAYDHPDYEAHERGKYKVEGRVLPLYADEALGPPKILHEGERAQSDWLYEFLHNPTHTSIHPALKIRMPTFQFSNEEVNTIVEGLANQGGVEFPYIVREPADLTPSELAQAQKLFTTAGCLTCHVVGEKLSPSQFEGSKGLAPDLWLVNERLHSEWVSKFLSNPDAMIPGTRMPRFWSADGTSPVPDVLGGDSKAQIELLTRYLNYLGQKRVRR